MASITVSQNESDPPLCAIVLSPDNPVGRSLIESVSSTDESSPSFVGDVVRSVLEAAVAAGASDLHFTPTEIEMQISWRIDGVLHPVASLPRRFASNVIARLKVLADLLTYKTEVPQEGRIRCEVANVEMRLSTFPTLYGEKGVVRLFAASDRFVWTQDLGLPSDIHEELLGLLNETTGALLITGSAGSGKTTTAYACLRHLKRESDSGKSLVTLEDPIESVLQGVSQSQVNRAAGFDYATGIRSMLRQDPDVIMVGEIRDRETAETVFQACLTGHLVISTFHAGSAAEAATRLSDMGIEPYLLRTGLMAVICQKLFRRLCECATWSEDDAHRFGFHTPRVRIPLGCSRCGGTGYRGRRLLAEILKPQSSLVSKAILSRCDASELHHAAEQSGMASIFTRAAELVESGELSPVEVRRVLGFRASGSLTR